MEQKRKENEKLRIQKQKEKEKEAAKLKNPKSKEAKEFAKTPAASTRAKKALAVPEPPAKRKRT